MANIMTTFYIMGIWFVIGEFIIIITIILMTFILKFSIYLRTKREEKIAYEIIDYLKKLSLDDSSFSNKRFKTKWRRLDILLPIVNKQEQQVDPQWEIVRIAFFQEIILPLARTATSSKKWELRYYAAKSFSLFFESGDEIYILKLVDDKVSLIRYNAIIPAILYGSEKSINLIITQMAANPWLTQFIYLREFYNASGTSRIYIENRLINSTEPDIRYVCYKLLLNYSPLPISWDYEPDITSNYLPLKMVTIVYISHIMGDKSIPILINLLNNSNWEVRGISLICLKNIKAYQCISNISQYLNDPNQWVTLIAMQTLYELGEQGLQILKEKNITYNPVAYGISKQLMKL